MCKCELYIASFPGLPRFFLFFGWFPLTIIHECGRAAFFTALPHRVLLSTETEEQKKRGRLGNEAKLYTYMLCVSD